MNGGYLEIEQGNNIEQFEPYFDDESVGPIGPDAFNEVLRETYDPVKDHNYENYGAPLDKYQQFAIDLLSSDVSATSNFGSRYGSLVTAANYQDEGDVVLGQGLNMEKAAGLAMTGLGLAFPTFGAATGIAKIGLGIESFLEQPSKNETYTSRDDIRVPREGSMSGARVLGQTATFNVITEPNETGTFSIKSSFTGQSHSTDLEWDIKIQELPVETETSELKWANVHSPDDLSIRRICKNGINQWSSLTETANADKTDYAWTKPPDSEPVPSFATPRSSNYGYSTQTTKPIDENILCLSEENPCEDDTIDFIEWMAADPYSNVYANTDDLQPVYCLDYESDYSEAVIDSEDLVNEGLLYIGQYQRNRSGLTGASSVSVEVVNE